MSSAGCHRLSTVPSVDKNQMLTDTPSQQKGMGLLTMWGFCQVTHNSFGIKLIWLTWTNWTSKQFCEDKFTIDDA